MAAAAARADYGLTAQQHSFDDAIASDRRNADAHNWVQLPAALSFNVSRQADIDR